MSRRQYHKRITIKPIVPAEPLPLPLWFVGTIVAIEIVTITAAIAVLVCYIVEQIWLWVR